MNLNNILWVYNTGKILPKAPVVENLLGMKLIGEGIITTATGNPVSIVTNKAQNAISTILSYSPKQSGSGDPSPQNIRPIEGWTEANLGVNSETPTKTISLGGTYYGFSVDVERGVLRNTYAIVDLGSLSWSFSSLGGGRVFTPKPDMLQGESGTSYFDIISNKYKSVSWQNTDNAIERFNNLIRIRDGSFDGMTTQEIKEALTGTQAVYPLATPIELPLTPQTVALLAGANTLWTDGDSLIVTYRR